MKELEIEVFRVGGSASRHVKPEHIAQVATFDCDANPIPICFGHPKSDTPAAGTIAGLRADGNSLFAKIKTFSDTAIEGIKKGEWINRSFAFFDPTHEANPRPGQWSPRHLGLLGGAAPGIPGMGSLQKALAFDAAEDAVTVDGDPADAVVYAGKPTNVVFVSTEEPDTVEKTPEQIAEDNRLAAARAQLDADQAAFAASQRSAFSAANSALVDGLVRNGKVLPAEVDKLKLVFDALGSDVLEFSATDKTTASVALAEFIASAIPKRVPVGERLSPTDAFDAGAIDSSNVHDAAGDLTAKANALIEKNPSLSFAAAIERASGGGNVDA